MLMFIRKVFLTVAMLGLMILFGFMLCMGPAMDEDEKGAHLPSSYSTLPPASHAVQGK